MPSVLDQSQRPPTQYLARAPLFFHFFNGVTPTSWGDPARDFPLFPLVRYPLRRNSAISATPLPPLPRPSRPCAAERTLRRRFDIPGRPRGGPIIFPIFYSSLHNMWSSGPAVALRRRAERRHERTWGRVPETRTNREKCRCHRHRAVHARWTIVDSWLTATSSLDAHQPNAPIA